MTFGHLREMSEEHIQDMCFLFSFSIEMFYYDKINKITRYTHAIMASEIFGALETRVCKNIFPSEIFVSAFILQSMLLQ